MYVSWEVKWVVEGPSRREWRSLGGPCECEIRWARWDGLVGWVAEGPSRREREVAGGTVCVRVGRSIGSLRDRVDKNGGLGGPWSEVCRWARWVASSVGSLVGTELS